MVNNIVYHYTTQKAFLNIISSGALRCSHIRFMNDSKEHIYLVESIEGALGRKLASSSLDSREKFLYEYIAREFRLVRWHLPRTHHYICCFSAIPDDLNQWRGYGKSIPSYSIGFQWDSLIKLAKASGFSDAQIAVTYDKDIGTQILDEYYKRFHNAMNDVFRNQELNEASARERMADALVEGVPLIGARYKHSGFESEKEYRLIFYSGQHELNYDTCQSYIKPYIEFDIGEDQIKKIVKEIWVGPGPNMDLAIDGAKMFLSHLGFEDVDKLVKRSEIPYRNW